MSMSASRRDVSEKGVKSNYFKSTNWAESKNEYRMVKVTFGALAVILALGAAVYFLNLGERALILVGVILFFWVVYFLNGIRVIHKFRSMPIKERAKYWTYELSDAYRDANVKLNDFKQQLAGSPLIDNTTLIDDVGVELVSLDPLIFDFSIRSAKATEQNIKTQVGGWAAKFSAHSGEVTRLDNISYRATFPMKGPWQILDGKMINPTMALSERTQDPGINWNPFGVRTTTMEEVAVVNSNQHVMITGISGYGKSACLNAILKAIMEDPNDALIVFFDAKRVEAEAVKDRCWVVYSEDQAKAWCDALTKEIGRRQHWQSINNKKKFATADKVSKDPDATPFTDAYPPIIIVVDECAMWLSGTEFKFQNLFGTFLTSISRVGRSNGMTLIVASQEAKTTSIPNSVSAQIDQRIAFKLNTQVEDEHAMGGLDKGEPRPSDIPDKTPTGGGGIGQCCAKTATTNGHIWPVKTYYVSGDALASTAKRTSYKKKRYAVVQYAEKMYNEQFKGKNGDPFQ